MIALMVGPAIPLGAAHSLLMPHVQGILCTARCPQVEACLDVFEAARAPHAPKDEDIQCVLSHFEAAALLTLQHLAPDEEGIMIRPSESFTVDIGNTPVDQLLLTPSGVGLEDSEMPCVTWAELRKWSKKQKVGAWECYYGSTELAAQKIEAYSDLTKRHASLLPLVGAVPPTAVLGGFNMHRMKDTHPGVSHAYAWMIRACLVHAQVQV